MTERQEAPRDPVAAMKQLVVLTPKFSEKGGLVGWAEAERKSLAPGAVHFEFDARPDVPTNGTWRLKAGTNEFEPIPPEKRWMPRFDAEGGYIGCDETTVEQVPPGALAFDHLPDNATDGRYRYDHNLKRFEPRPHILVKIGDTQAINKLIVAGIVGVVDRETLPLAIKDQIRFIEETSPQTVTALKKKFATLAGTVG